MSHDCYILHRHIHTYHTKSLLTTGARIVPQPDADAVSVSAGAATEASPGAATEEPWAEASLGSAIGIFNTTSTILAIAVQCFCRSACTSMTRAKRTSEEKDTHIAEFE
jgi:hypothetical protein